MCRPYRYSTGEALKLTKFEVILLNKRLHPKTAHFIVHYIAKFPKTYSYKLYEFYTTNPSVFMIADVLQNIYIDTVTRMNQ